jgi:hypothetical protein
MWLKLAKNDQKIIFSIFFEKVIFVVRMSILTFLAIFYEFISRFEKSWLRKEP